MPKVSCFILLLLGAEIQDFFLLVILFSLIYIFRYILPRKSNQHFFSNRKNQPVSPIRPPQPTTKKKPTLVMSTHHTKYDTRNLSTSIFITELISLVYLRHIGKFRENFLSKGVDQRVLDYCFNYLIS